MILLRDYERSALVTYQSLRGSARTTVRHRAVALAGRPARSALRDALQGNDDHPALRESLREWWLERATTDEITARIDASDERARELAVLLCAEACAHLSTDPRVAECRRVRFAWARGEATDEQRELARAAAWATTRAAWGPTRAAKTVPWTAAKAAAWDAARDAAWSASGDAARESAWAAAWAAARIVLGPVARAATKNAASAALAAPIRTLYPDPCSIDYRDGLLRWDVAVTEARSCLRSIGGAS